MDFRELCKQRYSVRNYLPKTVEKEKIEYLLECAQLAPSAANFQPWEFFIVSDYKIKSEIYKSYHREWLKSAPMCIVICNDTTQSWKRSATDNKDHGYIDIAIAAEHICLAATHIGLGTCWVCNFDPVILSQSLQLSDHLEPVVILPLGYIDEENSKVPDKKRKPISEFTRWI